MSRKRPQSFDSVAHHVWLFATQWTAACQDSLSVTNSQTLLKLTSNELVMPSNHLILCHPLLLLPSVFPSIRVFLFCFFVFVFFPNEPAFPIRWPKYWSFSFSISPSNEYSGLISFRIDWFDLLHPRDSQESSPAWHFRSIYPLEFSLLYGPTLTFVHDYWKNHSFGYPNLC